MIWFGWVLWHILTIVGYLMSNPLCTYYLIFMVCKHILFDKIFYQARAHFSTQLNDIKYCYVKVTI